MSWISVLMSCYESSVGGDDLKAFMFKWRIFFVFCLFVFLFGEVLYG